MKIALTTITYEGKHYAFHDWLCAIYALALPEGVKLDIIVADNSKNKAYYQYLSQHKWGFKKVIYSNPKNKTQVEVMAQSQNAVTDYAKLNSYDYIFNVEADIIVKPETLTKLLSHQRQVVGGLYMHGTNLQKILMQDSEKDGYEIATWNVEASYSMIVANGKLKRFHSIGIGCLLMQIGIFEHIRWRYDNNQDCYPDSLFNEDLVRANIPVFGDTSLIQTHLNQDWANNPHTLKKTLKNA